MKNARWIILGVLVLLLLIFAVQNSIPLPVNLLFVQIYVNLLLLIVITFVLGLLVGWFLGLRSGRPRSQMPPRSGRTDTV